MPEQRAAITVERTRILMAQIERGTGTRRREQLERPLLDAIELT
jgi:hypothetical protein